MSSSSLFLPHSSGPDSWCHGALVGVGTKGLTYPLRLGAVSLQRKTISVFLETE